MNRQEQFDLIVFKMRENIGKIDRTKFKAGFGPALLFYTAHRIITSIPDSIAFPSMTLSEAGELGMVWFFEDRQFDLIIYPNGLANWIYANGNMPAASGEIDTAWQDLFTSKFIDTLKQLHARFAVP